MKIDKVVFSTSEEFSPFWNIQSYIWKEKLGIEPVCILWGDVKNTKIVSEPYEFEILTDILGEPITHWFINVKYKKDICRVLFKECNVDADLEQRIEKHYDRIQIYKYMYPH